MVLLGKEYMINKVLFILGFTLGIIAGDYAVRTGVLDDFLKHLKEHEHVVREQLEKGGRYDF